MPPLSSCNNKILPRQSSTPPALSHKHFSQNSFPSPYEKWSIITLIALGALAIIYGIVVLSLATHRVFTPLSTPLFKYTSIGALILGCTLTVIGLYKLLHEERTVEEILDSPADSAGKLSLSTPTLNALMNRAGQLKESSPPLPLLNVAMENFQQKYAEAQRPHKTLQQWFRCWADVSVAGILASEIFKLKLLFQGEFSNPFAESRMKMSEPLQDKNCPFSWGQDIRQQLHQASIRAYSEATAQGEALIRSWAELYSDDADDNESILKVLLVLDNHKSFIAGIWNRL